MIDDGALDSLFLLGNLFDFCSPKLVHNLVEWTKYWKKKPKKQDVLL